MATLSPAQTALRNQTLRSLDRLPVFSPVLQRLMATLAREDASYAELAGLVEKDAVVTSNVLAIVNSAAYGVRGRVSAVGHAIALMGMGKLRNIVLGLSMSRFWNKMPLPSGWSNARFNQHAVAVGMLSDLLMQQVPVAHPEGAFTAGLLHDLGKLIFAVGVPEAYAEADRLAEATGRPRPECEQELLGITHAELSALALQKWNFPEPIRCGVALHHEAETAREVGKAPAGTLTLAETVAAADRVAHQLGLVVEPAPASDGHVAVEPPSLLTGHDVDWRRVQDQFEREFAAIRPHLQ